MIIDQNFITDAAYRFAFAGAFLAFTSALFVYFISKPKNSKMDKYKKHGHK